jgi:hypothetical protein
VVFGRCRKRRGGTPEGERVPLDARSHPYDAAHCNMRLPAFRFLYLPEASRKEVTSSLPDLIRQSMRRRG